MREQIKRVSNRAAWIAVPAGILSAGEGIRFRDAGVRVPKPLVRVAGRPLIGWVLEAFQRAGLREATVLLNSRNAGARRYALEAYPKLQLRWIIKDTASTLESFCVVSEALRAGARGGAGPAGPYLLSTVDGVYRSEELSRFLRRALRWRHCDLVLGVTRHRVDRTSLRVCADKRGVVRQILKGGAGPLATTGVYLCFARILREARRAQEMGVPNLSGFLSLCPAWGLRVGVVEMRGVFDVDRPEDVKAAERVFHG